MTIRQVYNEAVAGGYTSLIYLIEWLVYEKKAVSMDGDARNIEYVCEKYGTALNPHIAGYKRRVEQRRRVSLQKPI
ncbi:hypothetical protein [Alteribacter populi]|uniref:hypothetical protein n=1 Tax=Alteribacter populi TaxID=2011011 RepID=UPI000BBA85BE|nr:hypothetical protein [Alteribacter populi]